MSAARQSNDRKSIAILQSSYIPWKGYFDIIDCVDEFVFYDEVQFTSGDWRNRNRIKSFNGLQWLTIPVATTGKFGQAIDEVKIARNTWARKHWAAIRQCYSKMPFFDEYSDAIRGLFEESATETMLFRANRKLIAGICDLLGIKTKLSDSKDYAISGDPTEKLVEICLKTGAGRYLSGPAAKDYLREELFAESGIELQYADYSNYPVYPQPHGSFEHGVSVIDLIFCVGSDAPDHLVQAREANRHEDN